MTNSSDNNEIIISPMRCTTFFKRLHGMLGQPASAMQEGLLLRPCCSIHTFGMKFAIDAFFLDHDGRVIKAVLNLRPNRLAPIVPKAAAVYECPAGAKSIAVGQRLRLKEEGGPPAAGSLQNQKGASMVEFALLFFFFVIILMGLVDVVQVCYNWASVQFAVSRVSRYQSLGIYTTDQIKDKVVADAKALGVNIDRNTIVFTDIDSTMNVGKAERYVMPQAMVNFTANPVSRILVALTGTSISGGVAVYGKRAIKNEPYDPVAS